MIRTRFAPSPTGYLHIGGVRTALFNWLFARHHGGAFILRIDDTDARRNVDEALQPILDGFRWLGIDWDEGPGCGGEHGPYFQSQRDDRYREAVQVLLDRGAAYRDYATAEELQQERESAQAAKRRFIYSRRFMAQSPADRARFEAQGRPGVVRLKMPREGVCRFADLVRGSVEVDWAGEQDHVIQRADGSCLYHLASVVDDQAMEISHVIRAEEHLSNTPRQIFIARGLGYDLPEYAHLPFVAEPGSRNKLSKRKLDKYLRNPDFARLNERGRSIAASIGLATGADTFNPVIVDFYASVGFLPQAVVNYLLLLGWALDDRKEIFTRQEMVDHFSLARVNRAPASFDPDKLLAFQDRYMQNEPLERRAAMALPFLERAGLVRRGDDGKPAAVAAIDVDVEGIVLQILRAAGDRIKIAGDILDYAEFFTGGEALTYDEKAFDKRLRRPAEARQLLSRFRDRLAASEAFDAGTLERLLRTFIESEGVKIGQLIHALRVVVTGKVVGFGLFETLEILGRRRTLDRVGRALARLDG